MMFIITITLIPLITAVLNSRNFEKSTKWEECTGDQLNVNCRSQSELAIMVRELRRQSGNLNHLINDNCTVCWNGPCQNGGDCVPLSETEYRCDCPSNYKGKNCEILLECGENTCGQNAICFVNHHMLNCVCKPGYTGDPVKGCTVKSMIAGMAGDPHYRTFDEQRYDYMGTCPYHVVVPCGESLPGQFRSFTLKAKNELSFPNAHVSTVSEFEVNFHGHIFHVDKFYNLYVDGIRMTMPYHYPNWAHSKLSITFKNSHVTVRDETFITIYFSHGMLYVEMPDVESLNGPDVICGLAGNRDSNCSNDFRTKNGYFYTPVNDSCSNRGEYFTEQFGDSYITSEFLNVNGGDETDCLKGISVANVTKTCDTEEAEKLCEPILEALKATGPFAVCQNLEESLIQDFFHDCVFDVCQRQGLICTIFSVFAKNCQLRLPNTSLNWRRAVGCSDIHCPLHSKYSPCASACPRTCASPDLVELCTETCMEGCECEPGYLLDDSIPISPQCVMQSECGCKDDDGNYHPEKINSESENYWLTNDCATINVCESGTYDKRGINCSENAHCGVDEHFQMRCRCNKGFEGDGFMCEDIDECADPHTCNVDKNQGKCINTPGSYFCTCADDYEGSECELYRPTRHCADLYVYHGERKSQFYTISIPKLKGNESVREPVNVYCDMETEEDGIKGGWTLISNTFNSTSNKTYQEYVDGFGGETNDDVWLGLHNFHILTTQTKMKLRVNLKYCATQRKPMAYTYCTYPEFKVLDASKQYAVVVPMDCRGNDSTYVDGWVRWTTDIGPSFYAIDNDPSNCSQYFHSTGWWFDHKHRCGAANLNGRRYICDDPPALDQLGKYLTWNNNPVSTVYLLLRPADYPNYDPESTTSAPPTLPITHIPAHIVTGSIYQSTETHRDQSTTEDIGAEAPITIPNRFRI